MFASFATIEAFAGSPFGLVLWGGISIVCASQLEPGAAYLKLNTLGFEVRAFFRQWYCLWPDVMVFDTARTFGSGEMVVFRLSPSVATGVMAPVASRWLDSRWDGRLPDKIHDASRISMTRHV